MRLLAVPLLFSSVAVLLLPHVAAFAQFPRIKAKLAIKKPLLQPDAHSGRQFRHRRDLTDNCVSTSGTKFSLLTGIKIPLVGINICLCSRDIDVWLATDENGKKLVANLGIVLARAALVNFAHGSAVPVHQPPVTNLIQAKLSCNINESVCGIPGREDTQEYECVDTSVALESCGGCMIPHPFYEPHRVTSTAVDCGRLPGVLSASCHNSQCIISRCKKGLQLSSNNTECVPVSKTERILMDGILPLFALNHKRQDIVANVIPNSDLVSQIRDIVTVIVSLETAAESVPPRDNSTATINIPELVQSTIDAVTNLAKSNTVAAVSSNIQTLLEVLASFKTSLGTCGCVGELGLDDILGELSAATELVEKLLTWLDANSIAIPKSPYGAFPEGTTISIPNASDIPINLGLSSILDFFRDSEVALPPTSVDGDATDFSVAERVTSLTKAVLGLKSTASSHFSSSASAFSHGGTPSAGSDVVGSGLNHTLADPIVQATIDLVASSDMLKALSNINTLINTNSGLVNALGALPNPSPSITELLEILDTVGVLALDLRNKLYATKAPLINMLPGLGPDIADLVGNLTSVQGPAIESLQSRLSALAKLILSLQSHTSSLKTLMPSIPSTPSPGLPGGPNLLRGVVREVGALLGAQGVVELLSGLEAVVRASVMLERTLRGCRCVEVLALQGVLKGLEELKARALELEGFVSAEQHKELGVAIKAVSVAQGSVLRNAEVLVKALAL
ncbi:hypothetical protein H0H81_005046 [Sphagnurus paluster]|uniref:Protein CPL1-like domain-containing protein n=1 Tax=Sphagnurus paluster TaxID=117069 RepID=A0A9P7K560_9AGAR|nr:hypothetical protein H0H81_005046 [Sphagnurus paluster]